MIINNESAELSHSPPPFPQVVVIIVIWIISLLVIYMLFLVCLDPFLNKKAPAQYQEHNNEDVRSLFLRIKS